MHVLGKMSLRKHYHQKFPKGIIHRAKSSVSSTSCDSVFLIICCWSYQNHQKSSICHCRTRFVHQKLSKTTPKMSWSNNLPSQVERLQYNNRLHMTVCFINFSRHSIIVDRAYGTGLIILTESALHTVKWAIFNLKMCWDKVQNIK